MNTKRLIYIAFIFILISCNKTSDLVYTDGGSVANPKRLSAGNATIFNATNLAFDSPSPVLKGELLSRFINGDNVYDQAHVANPAVLPGTGGLGPLYIGFSCTGCHEGSGRTIPSLHTHGGSGKGFSTQLIFMKSTNGQNFPEYGRCLHDQAIVGVQPEGKLKVKYTEKTFQFTDGEEYSLLYPYYWITDWYATKIPREDLVLGIRIPLRHVGMGFMIAVDQDMIKDRAANQYPEYGITGRVNYISERNQRKMGLSGYKAQHADLTVELGFMNEMGLKNSRYPKEVCEGQPQFEIAKDEKKLDISDKEMADCEFYMMTLGVPSRRDIDDKHVKEGEKKFYEAKCHLCHMPTLRTSSKPIQLLDGTPMKMLANKTFHPYSDYLLHDMGPELGDNYSQGKASGDEWRTTPLWGIGLQKIVSGHTYMLHDGRARNINEAIMWHGGEGSVSREIYKNMSKQEREDLITFVNSL